MRIAFDPTHPFKPPFVRVRYPRFQKGTSNVMEVRFAFAADQPCELSQGGAICVDTFSVAGWSPAMTAEKSIVAIQSVLLTPNLDARLDPIAWAKEYTEEEASDCDCDCEAGDLSASRRVQAKVSLKVIQQAHKDWQQPQFSTPPATPSYAVSSTLAAAVVRFIIACSMTAGSCVQSASSESQAEERTRRAETLVKHARALCGWSSQVLRIDRNLQFSHCVS